MRSPRRTTRSPVPAPTRPAAPRPSRCSASRTGSVARSRTWLPFARRSRSRSWRRSSWSTRASCHCSGPPGRISCCSSPSCTRPVASPAWSRPPWTSGSSRSSRRTTPASWIGRWRPGRGSSGSTPATCGRSTWTRSGPSACARRSRVTGSPSPSRVCAMRPRSPAGGPSGTTRRSSARPSCGHPTRGPPPPPSSRPAVSHPTRQPPTARRSSRSARSPTRSVPSLPSEPVQTPSG